LLSKAGLTALAILTVAPSVSAQAIPPPSIIDFSLPPGFQIPRSDPEEMANPDPARGAYH